MDIAVIGIGCRVPGADNIEDYWRVLSNGENHIIDIPKERWNNEAFYSENKDEPGTTYVKKAGFISGHDEWDNKLFGVSDSEALHVDPQQRLALECTHMALEDAGLTRQQIKGTETGVYLGVMNDDYKSLSSFDHEEDTNYSATGMSSTIISARVSYVYDLRGPCMVVDTACSSSMVALHLGSQAIRSGDCEMAICGGVSSILIPDQFITLCKARMLSPSGQCQSFCDTADGYGRGEGCGIVILKSYKQAVNDKNNIWGIVKTGSNQDGRVAQPITAPSGQQQEELLRKVYNLYEIDPSSLQYIEAHGTGTSIGDPTEINAIGRFMESFKLKRPPDKQDETKGILSTSHLRNSQNKSDAQDANKCLPTDDVKTILIGSVKSNIGHLESAAGVAALIKVLLMMKYGKFVPSLHVKKDKSNINKKIAFETYGLDISLNLSDWKQNKKGERICCVNCFGFGGSNTHAVVIQNEHMASSLHTSFDNNANHQYKIVCVSGPNKTSLIGNIEALKNDLATGQYMTRDISFTSIYHRDHFTYRTLVFGQTDEDIRTQLGKRLLQVDKMESQKKIRIVFVFCGVGTTWKGMCCEMMKTQVVFRKTVNEIDEILKPLTGWSIAETFLSDTDYSDPFLNHIAIFCAQVALFEQWKSWGIHPKAIVGQSVGEVAASYASGALALADAVQVIYHRSQILSEMTGGKMMVVGNIAVSTIESLCQKLNNRVTIAVYNSPVSCTVSGDADAIEQLKIALEDMNQDANVDVLIRPLSVKCAYHSHHMEPCIEKIESKLIINKKGNRTTDQFSTVTGKLAETEEFQTGKYWADNIRKPVLFMNAIVRSADENAQNMFIEIGPRPVLRAHLSHVMGKNLKGLCLPSINLQKENEIMYTSLNTLFEVGVNIKWENVVPVEGNIVPVPRYIFQKTKLLHIPEGKLSLLRGNNKQHPDSHMYLRRNTDGKPDFIIHLDEKVSPFVYDHFLFNAVLVPGATYVEAAFEIGHQKSSLNVFEIGVSVEFVNTCMPAHGKQCLIDVDVGEEGPDEFQFLAKKDGRVLSLGHIFPRTQLERKQLNIPAIKGKCTTHRTKLESYKCLDNLHFRYGESLSVIVQSWSSTTECIVEFTLPESVFRHRKVTHMHPCVIDGMFQTFGILSSVGSMRPTLPKGVSSFIINRPPERFMYGYSRLIKSTSTGNHYNSLLLSQDGYVIAEICDFYTKSMTDASETPANMAYSSVWREIKLPAPIEKCEEKQTRECEEKSKEKDHLVIVSSKRFISVFKPPDDQRIEYLDIESDSTKNALSHITGVRSIVYAPFFHIQHMNNDGTLILEYVKKSFLYLAQIISKLKERNEETCVFIVTENAIGHISRKDGNLNVCGAELWGMVRSAVSEEAYSNLCLIDTTTSEEDITVLKTVLASDINGYNEFLIESGKCHCAEVLEESDTDIPFRRAINAYISEDVILQSSATTNVNDLHFEVRGRETIGRTNNCKILLKMFCLHSSSVFPISQPMVDEEELTLSNEDAGYSVICLEGIGQRYGGFNGNDSGNTKVVFCCPVCVSTVVSIPQKCTVDLTTLPVYFPGMITVGLILWNIFDACKHLANACVIVEDKSKHWVQIMRHLVSKMSGSVHIETMGSVNEWIPNKRSCIRTLIVLSKLTSSQFGAVERLFPSLHDIVSVEEYFSKTQKIHMKMKIEKIRFTILKTEDIFTLNELTKTVPKLYNTFKSMDNICAYPYEQQSDSDAKQTKQKDILNLPYSIISLNTDNEETRIPLKVSQKNVFRKNSCYILVGGLTGLGWELVQYMANLGAGYIATLSRRLPTKDKENEIEQIKTKHGCQVINLQVDITNLSQLTSSFEKLKAMIGSGVDIRGIFHGGGVTRDTFLRNMTEKDLETVLLPKVLGTWNLHVVTSGIKLDFFIMHSSIVSVFGNQGQCNYAAGNSFQDSFAHYRRSLGLSGQSINWSTLSLGMATENKELEKYLSSQGFHYLTKDEIRQCFIQAVMANKIQIMFGKFDWHKLKDNPVLKMNPNKFAEILKRVPTITHASNEPDKTLDICELSRQDPSRRKQLIYEIVKSKIAETFVVDESTLTESTKILTLGIDSLAAMSFTNAIFDVTKVRISIGTLFDEATTVEFITTFIVTRIHSESDSVSSEMEQNNARAKEYLQGDITFMQKTLIDDFVKAPFSRNIMRQVDFEISGLVLQKRDMKIVLNHLVQTNPDLRRIYSIAQDGTYSSSLLEGHDIQIEDVEFNSICGEHALDERDTVRMDITKEMPIRVLIAFKKDTTRIRMFVHAILGDLSGITNLFREIGDILKCHLHQRSLPVKKTDVDPAESVRRAIIPQISKLRMYWKSTLSEDIRPFTFFADINNELEEKYWENISHEIPTFLVDSMMDFINSQRLSLYHFIISVYMVLLHEKTGQNYIPLVTFADMRSHVLQLQAVLQSCSNAIPIVGDLRKLGPVATFLKRSSDKLNEITEHSAYPYELIQDEMISEELKKHIGRHRFVMENMTTVQNHFNHEGVEIKIGNVYYKRHVYETTLHAEYDTKRNGVILQFGYNGKAIAKAEAENILERMQKLIQKFVDGPHREIKAILEEASITTDVCSTKDRTVDQQIYINKQLTRHHTETDYCGQPRKEFRDINQAVILTERFTKQTTQGWEHTVQLKLTKQIFGRQSGELLLSWGRGKKERIVNGRDIAEIEVRKINGLFYVLIKTHAREFVFKASSVSKAMGLLTTFKEVDEEIKLLNREQMLCNL